MLTKRHRLGGRQAWPIEGLVPIVMAIGAASLFLLAGCAGPSGSQSGGSGPTADQPTKAGASKEGAVSGARGVSKGGCEVPKSSELRLTADLAGLDSQASFAEGAGIMEVGTPRIAEYARSTAKVLIVAALLDRVGGVDRLSSAEAQDARLAIADSNNDAARRLFERLGSPNETPSSALNSFLEKNGFSNPLVPESVPSGLPPSFISPYGAAEWGTAEQAGFVELLWSNQVLPSSSVRYLETLMTEVTPLGGADWGLGTTGEEAAFKGGWGDNPDGTFIARQLGVVRLKAHPEFIPVALIAVGNSQEDAYARASSAARILTEVLKKSCVGKEN